MQIKIDSQGKILLKVPWDTVSINYNIYNSASNSPFVVRFASCWTNNPSGTTRSKLTLSQWQSCDQAVWWRKMKSNICCLCQQEDRGWSLNYSKRKHFVQLVSSYTRANNATSFRGHVSNITVTRIWKVNVQWK